MPSGALRPCPCGCHRLVRKGRCSTSARSIEQARGTATQRGYGAAWRAFRPQFIGLLLGAGIPPICGAALPDGPTSTADTCLAEGKHTHNNQDGSSLHFDHDPPLADYERQDIAAVCDPKRIMLRCRDHHTAKTVKESR